MEEGTIAAGTPLPREVAELLDSERLIVCFCSGGRGGGNSSWRRIALELSSLATLRHV